MPTTSTALQIAQRVADAIGIEQLASLETAGEENPRRMLTLLNRGGQVLASKRGSFGEGWPELTREHVFTTIADQPGYSLPQGFSELINDSVWDRDTYRQAPGPLSPQQWQAIKGGLIESVALTPRYRLKLNENTSIVQFFIDPTPTVSGERLAFEYMSVNWVRPSLTSAISQSRVVKNTDIPVFPEHLVEIDLEWRTRKSVGLNYSTDLAEFEMERDRLFAQSVGKRTIHMGERYGDGRLLGLNVPESGFGLTPE